MYEKIQKPLLIEHKFNDSLVKAANKKPRQIKICRDFSIANRFFDYTAKLSPHPQVREAFGLINWKPFPFKPSEKSRVVPAK